MASFLTKIVALVDNASIYTYNLPLLSLLSLIAYMARNVLDNSIVGLRDTEDSVSSSP